MDVFLCEFVSQLLHSFWANWDQNINIPRLN